MSFFGMPPMMPPMFPPMYYGGGGSYRKKSSYRKRRVWGTKKFKKSYWKCKNGGGSYRSCIKKAKKSTRPKWYWKTVVIDGFPTGIKTPRKGYAIVWKASDPKRSYAVRAKSGKVPEKYLTDEYMVNLPDGVKDPEAEDGMDE